MSRPLSTSLEFERRDEPGVPVLAVTGDLDVATASHFALAVGSILALDRPSRFVVDLAGVRFMDSTGLNELVRAHKALRRLGGQLVLRSPNDTAKALLDVTRLTGHLEIE